MCVYLNQTITVRYKEMAESMPDDIEHVEEKNARGSRVYGIYVDV